MNGQFPDALQSIKLAHRHIYCLYGVCIKFSCDGTRLENSCVDVLEGTAALSFNWTPNFRMLLRLR
jgi:hypothetical protein